MKKQFTMVPNDGYHGDIIRVTKYEDGVRKESFCVLDCEVNSTRAELEKDGWICSVDINFMQEQIDEHCLIINGFLLTMKDAFQSGNFILEFDGEEE